MREMLFKNMTSKDFKKRDLTIREDLRKNGFVAHTERRCFYFVREVVSVEGSHDIDKLAKLKTTASNDSNKRNFHIMRVKDSNTGREKLVCKVCGMIYAIIANKVYAIGFLHSFKINFSPEPVI